MQDKGQGANLDDTRVPTTGIFCSEASETDALYSKALITQCFPTNKGPKLSGTLFGLDAGLIDGGCIRHFMNASNASHESRHEAQLAPTNPLLLLLNKAVAPLGAAPGWSVAARGKRQPAI
jgi:hypothetical protein